MASQMDYSLTQAVVIDNGTGFLKAGFAGEDRPLVVTPSCIGRPKHEKIMAGALDGDAFVGDKAQEHRGLLSLKYPMEHGTVSDWNDMERIWRYVLKDAMPARRPGFDISDHPVLLTEAPFTPNKNREKTAEIFFETFTAPALFFSMQAVLSLYAAGRTTGVVLDVGDGVTHAVPVYEGFAIPHAITRSDVAGRDVTERLQLLLRKEGHVFHTSAEKEIVRTIKEQLCYVARDYKKEEDLVIEKSFPSSTFELPDGRNIKISAERFRAPEVLFKPSLIGVEYDGVHDCLLNAIQKTDIDLRKRLYSEIILSGGSTLFSGFAERLLVELKKGVKEPKYRIAAPADRMLSTWNGGSILAALASFKKMWVTKHDYQEYGYYILHSKTL
eukprot:TRINITY_DN9385_c0_g1::TRINITY_DN9385_c0_g1_i1::g.28382::m.28382 TRINITY_DN9385_c0_g1::TRINITY_DN9385_c0_g1_i1::g.28382  ORF type:complete len:398 (+),score=113.40,sp/P85515/ACTZ_RAT/60.63/1e-163,Actin/PF00022.14/2.4e-128,MreB_Mbl/PF06723.8/28,MreB_Mbl/PF06723.8/1.9 TRINITY_DN9385_c0_g1_i1:42-1196(+)